MISTTESAISYTTNGSQTAFDFPYALIATSHLALYLDGTLTTSGFGIALNADPDTGAVVTFTTAPTTGQTLEIVRTTPATQLTDYVGGSKLNPETLEDDHDKQALILQELRRDLDRAVKMPRASTGNTQLQVGDYGDFVAITAGGDIEGRAGTSGASPFSLGDVTDVDVIAVSAAGTTTITIPDTQTGVFGALVTASAGAGAYTHNIDLPAGATTGQRALIRMIVDSSSTNPTAQIRDDGGTAITEALLNPIRGVRRVNADIVYNGTNWVLSSVKYGDIDFDRHVGVSHYPTDATTLQSALSDSGTDVRIYINNLLTLGGILDFDLDVELQDGHKMIFGDGAGINFADDNSWHLRVTGEILTAYEGQQIFFNCIPGSVTGKFGGAVRYADWWYGSGEALLGWTDDWWAIQCAVWAGDWDKADASNHTISNWNDTTNVITIPDTEEIGEGMMIEFHTAALASNVTTTRPYKVVNATNGTGDNISTFQIGAMPKGRGNFVDHSPLDFGSGGSTSARVSRTTCQTRHTVRLLTSRTWSINAPIDMSGTGVDFDLNGATVQATEQDGTSGSVWLMHFGESEFYPDGAGQAFTKTDYVSGPNTTDITITNHGYVDNDVVEFTALTTAGNLRTGEGYIVNQIDANTFRLRISSSTSDIDLGDNVAGTVQMQGGHAAMFEMGSGAGGESATYRPLPQTVKNGTISGAGVPGVSIFGAQGTIPRRSRIHDVDCSLATRHFIGWARDWDARPGTAASNDFSGLLVENFRYLSSFVSGSQKPCPCHTPGFDVHFRHGELRGNTLISGDLDQIWYGAGARKLVIEDVTFDDAFDYVNFVNHGLYQHVTMRGCIDNGASVKNTTSITSLTMGRGPWPLAWIQPMDTS
jgi:hypothetical protein